jgi:hypothetical protein
MEGEPMLLSELVSRLEGIVPVYDGTPSESQYEQAVMDGVDQMSQDAGRTKIGSLSIVSGTASYALADDCVHLASLDGVFSGDGVILSDAGIIPLSGSWQERYTVTGTTITFTPTPGYTMVRNYVYQAGHVLDDSNSYPDMTTNEARIALAYAAHECLLWIANKAAAQAWTYQVGQERYSMERLAESYRMQSDAMLKQYKQAISRLAGSVTVW